MNRSLALLTTAIILLGGYQSLLPRTDDGTPPVEEATVTPSVDEPQTYGSLSSEMLFALLTAALAGPRIRLDIDLGNYRQPVDATLDAQRAAAVQLARGGRYDESMLYMEKVLQGQGNTHFDFLALSAAETDPDTRAGLLQSFDRLQQKYPDNGQLLFGKALLLQQDGRPEEALEQ